MSESRCIRKSVFTREIGPVLNISFKNNESVKFCDNFFVKFCVVNSERNACFSSWKVYKFTELGVRTTSTELCLCVSYGKKAYHLRMCHQICLL